MLLMDASAITALWVSVTDRAERYVPPLHGAFTIYAGQPSRSASWKLRERRLRSLSTFHEQARTLTELHAHTTHGCRAGRRGSSLAAINSELPRRRRETGRKSLTQQPSPAEVMIRYAAPSGASRGHAMLRLSRRIEYSSTGL